MTSPRILLVEDERAQIEVLTYNLQSEGYRVIQAEDGEQGLLLAEEEIPDLIILDWMLPEISGIEVCRQLRAKIETKHIPIVMLTARGEENDRIRGLDTGADDYVSKPYSINELVARVRALLRRTRPGSTGETLTYETIVLDPVQHRVTRNDVALKLGPTEYRLLATFMEKPGRVWSREQLLDRVWGRDKDVDVRTVDVHVGRLRKALCPGNEANVIRTVRGTGYSLDNKA